MAAAVAIDLGRISRRARRALSDLDDSKRLSSDTRERLSEALWACCDQIVVSCASARTIDRDGLHATNLRLMRDLAARLDPTPDALLVDGFELGEDAPIHERVIGGDRRSACIAAASVIAKTTRDRLMRGPAARAHPEFGFDGHVGYATAAHREAVAVNGLSPLHRRSFRSVAYSELRLFDSPDGASLSQSGR